MKWIFYLAALAAALLWPGERTDVAKLQPVEVVCLYEQQGMVTLETDTGDLGRGVSAEAALRDLENSTPGIVYLDTAAFLVVDELGNTLISEIKPYLKDKVRVCQMEEKPDLELTAPYLNVHLPRQTLGNWAAETELEMLYWENERLTLKNP